MVTAGRTVVFSATTWHFRRGDGAVPMYFLTSFAYAGLPPWHCVRWPRLLSRRRHHAAWAALDAFDVRRGCDGCWAATSRSRDRAAAVLVPVGEVGDAACGGYRLAGSAVLILLGLPFLESNGVSLTIACYRPLRRRIRLVIDARGLRR